jgi:hypothetical protein
MCEFSAASKMGLAAVVNYSGLHHTALFLATLKMGLAAAHLWLPHQASI